MKTATHHPFLPWAVWGVAVFAYAVAIVNRTSLAALGPATQDHFQIDATTLATFAMLQLVVYAGLQIPVGTLLDRYGSSVMIVSGSILMVFGQVLMATVSEVWLAILARILVGAGDACIFISVIRVLPSWFSLKQLPTVSQITGILGQAGQLISVVPLALAVSNFGWTPAFLGVASAAFLAALLTVCVVRDTPTSGTLFQRFTASRGSGSGQAVDAPKTSAQATESHGPPATELFVLPVGSRFGERGEHSPKWLRGLVTARRVLRIPGVRLAYWIHFTLPFAVNNFVLLWGTPFLMGGMGLSRSDAATLLSLVVVSAMFGGLTFGPLSSRFAEKRVMLTLFIAVLGVGAWCVVLFWPGVPPFWVLVVMTFCMSLGGPASMIAFEVSRSHTPVKFSGFVTGLVNTGGFTASLLLILVIGLLLDALGAGSPETYSREAFVVAFSAQLPFWILGITMIIVERKKTMKWMRDHGRTL